MSKDQAQLTKTMKLTSHKHFNSVLNYFGKNERLNGVKL